MCNATQHAPQMSLTEIFRGSIEAHFMFGAAEISKTNMTEHWQSRNRDICVKQNNYGKSQFSLILNSDKKKTFLGLNSKQSIIWPELYSSSFA